MSAATHWTRSAGIELHVPVQADYGHALWTLAKTDFGQNRLWPKPTLAKPTLAKSSLICCVVVLCVVCVCVLCGVGACFTVSWSADSGPPRLHTTTRELQMCTFERPGASNTTKIPREDTQRGKKRTNFAAGEGNKSAKFWPLPPPLPTLRASHPSGPHFFWVWGPGLHPFMRKRKEKNLNK